MKITYYLEVISSWCHWVEPAWAELQRRYAGRVEFDWKIALMDSTGLPASKKQCEWFYRRSGTIMRSATMLNSGWFEQERREYPAPNLVAQAAKALGVKNDSVRLAIADAALREGVQVGRWEESVRVAAAAANLDPATLLAKAQSAEIESRARQSTAEFYALKVSQRPAFLLENNIGDRAVFSGLARIEPIAAAIDAMLGDAAAYASYAAHHGGPPAA